jgi:hypothetical protein
VHSLYIKISNRRVTEFGAEPFVDGFPALLSGHQRREVEGEVAGTPMFGGILLNALPSEARKPDRTCTGMGRVALGTNWA